MRQKQTLNSSNVTEFTQKGELSLSESSSFKKLKDNKSKMYLMFKLFEVGMNFYFF